MNNILIAGCGDLGTRLGLALNAAGHTVYGLRRQQTCPAPIISLQADLQDAKSLQILPSNIDAVFFTAAASEFSAESYEKTYIHGVQNLLDSLQKPLQRLIFTSSTAVYAYDDGRWVDEDSPTTPRHFSGTTMLAAEKLALNSKQPCIIARCAGIYGPQRRRLIDKVLAGEGQLLENPAYTNRIHIEDCVAALLHLYNVAKPGEVYNICDSKPLNSNEVLQKIAQYYHCELLPAQSAPLHAQRGNKRVSNKKLLASGFKHRYPEYSLNSIG